MAQVYAVAYNYASAPGNRERLAGLEIYSQAVQKVCTENFQPSLDVQQQQQQELDAAYANHATAAANMVCPRTATPALIHRPPAVPSPSPSSRAVRAVLRS